MEHLGFFHDTARCIDCRACQVACKEKNKLSAGEFCRRADTLTLQTDDTLSYIRFSMSCNHCANPACVAVCPTGAMYIAADGTVQHSDEQCIGCGRCAQHCPYGAVSMNKYSGYAQKCDACIDRREGGQLPVCVEACPMRALHFGPMDGLKKHFGAEHGATLPFLPPEEMTTPSLMVRGGENKRPAISSDTPAAVSHAQDTFSNSVEHILILGSGIAALSAARELRARSAHVTITIVSREKRLPYSRPMLSKGLTGSFAMDRYELVCENWLKDEKIAFIGDAEIAALHLDAHEVLLRDGRSLSFAKCIYALGSDCFLPPILGAEKAGIFTLRNSSDLAAIRREMLTAKRVLINGGGITGLEIAWELKKSGLEVTVIEPLPQLMDRFIDQRSAAKLKAAVENAGIRVYTNTFVTAFEGDGHVRQAALSNGSSVPVDFAIISAGYRPNVALAAAAGLSCHAAIHVDEGMRTSHSDVFACGDCTDRSTATWMQSVRQGKVAAANALGAEEVFSSEQEPVMVHTADTSLLMIGDMGKQSGKSYRHFYAEEAYDTALFRVNPYKEPHKTASYAFCFAENTLQGATVVGNLNAMLLVEQAVKEHWSFDLLREAMLKRGVELSEE
ncbi:MAG: FAD-dependent oxidoreductase [Oscillospiraceae bacterium]|nr:FAD-dependent oxidoreductase [Oscillospiraceae bacterium]